MPVQEPAVPVHPLVMQAAHVLVPDQENGPPVLGVLMDRPGIVTALRLGGERHPSPTGQSVRAPPQPLTLITVRPLNRVRIVQEQPLVVDERQAGNRVIGA